MLTHLLAALPVRVAHALLRLLGIDRDAMHTWCPGICPCDAYEDTETPGGGAAGNRALARFGGAS